MRFYKTSEYAIRALVYMAIRKEEIFSVRRLHQALNIPYKYLSRLMHRLADAGLVRSIQGKQGGFQICQNIESVYIYQIIDAVEGLENYNRCILGFEECSDDNPCPLHDYWLPIRDQINHLLYHVSLANLVEKVQNKI